MGRKLRVEFPGAISHVLNRGDGREEVFKADKDRARFLETLGETCAQTCQGIAVSVNNRGPR